MHKLIQVVLILCCIGCNQKAGERTTIFYVNSYHQGYEPSDKIFEGFISELDTAKFQLEVVYMDTKLNPSLDYAQMLGLKLVDRVKNERPDFLVISDDPAMKYVAEPVLQITDIPVLFSGVNWSVDEYDIQEKNTVGVIEVLPLEAFILDKEEKGWELDKISILTEDSFSEVNSSRHLTSYFLESGLEVEYFFVSNFDDWVGTFKKLNEQKTFICLPTNGAIKGWDKESALTLVEKYTKMPTITFDAFMMNYAAYGYVKIEQELGIKKAGFLKSAISGADLESLQILENSEFEKLINPVLKDLIDKNQQQNIMNNEK